MLLLFRVGNLTLHPWDEAWYGSIAKNILKTGRWLDLQYNGRPFWDHPPLGFWLQSTSYSIFGVSDWATRLPTILAGVLTVLILLWIGKEMKRPLVGAAAGLILLSSRWWLMRARTGNLDILLTLTQVWVFYLMLKVKSPKRLLQLWFFYGVSFLSKSAISATLLPLMMWVSYMFLKDKDDWKKLIMKSIGVFAIPLIPWYGFNTIKYGMDFLIRNVWVIGLREMSGEGVSSESAIKTLLYLRSAIHRWYRPVMLTAGLGLPLAIRNRYIRFLLAYLSLTLLPYFLSSKSEIWHLIPAMAPIALLIPTVMDEVVKRFFKDLKILRILTFVAILTISIWSIKEYWKDTIDLPKTVSHEARLAMEASKSELPLYLQDNSYLPTVVYYANKNVEVVSWVKVQDINEIEKPFQIIVREYILGGTDNYKEIARSGDTLLIEYVEEE
jgi:4-amino-4-deoxy-L-arabinose transferase-like glycosyltransferase